MDNTEATVELNWIEVTHPDNVTVTHTPALNDADEWDWDTAVLMEPR